MRFNPDNLNRLYRYGVALCASEPEAEDLLHASIERYLDTRQHTSIEHPESFIRRAMRNRWFDELRKKQTRQTYDAESPADDEPIPVLDQNPLESMIATQDQVAQFWGELDPSQRELLYFSCILEFSAQEIADEFGQPRGTILSRLHRLKKSIEHKLALANEPQEAER